MRILFCAVPGAGHVFPLLPLEEAARAAGHVTALATGGELRALLPAAIELLPVGRTAAEAMEEAARRVDDHHTPLGDLAVELFGGVAVDFAYDDLLESARAFSPDLIVAESYDYPARIVASRLGVPWAAHEVSDELPAFHDAIGARASAEFARRGVVPTSRIALVDPYPDVLRDVDRPVVADRLPIRPGFAPPVSSYVRSARPTVLLTFGTSLPDGRIDPDAMLDAVIAAGADAIVTRPDARVPSRFPRDRVEAVGFRPLAELLPRVDAVLFPGGSGTLLAALAAGVPMVIQAVHADQPVNSAAAARIGVAVSIESETEAAGAITTILQTESYRIAARRVADDLAAVPGPGEVLTELISRVSSTAR